MPSELSKCRNCGELYDFRWDSHVCKEDEKLNTKSELNSVKKLVLRVLEEYPETRNSDTKLYKQCAKLLGARYIDDIDTIGLNIITIHKVRQQIQNRDGMFLPTEDVKQARVERQLSFKDWMVEV